MNRKIIIFFVLFLIVATAIMANFIPIVSGIPQSVSIAPTSSAPVTQTSSYLDALGSILNSQVSSIASIFTQKQKI